MNDAVMRPLRVLIVEDEPLIRWSIAETLANSGHSVLEASDAASAVRALKEASRPVDIVLLDYTGCRIRTISDSSRGSASSFPTPRCC